MGSSRARCPISSHCAATRRTGFPAKGVGPKGAATLLRKYASLDEALADGQLTSQAEQLLLYRRIATMDRAAPIPVLPDRVPHWDKAAALVRDWDLARLAERLDALAANWAAPLHRPPS